MLIITIYLILNNFRRNLQLISQDTCMLYTSRNKWSIILLTICKKYPCETMLFWLRVQLSTLFKLSNFPKIDLCLCCVLFLLRSHPCPHSSLPCHCVLFSDGHSFEPFNAVDFAVNNISLIEIMCQSKPCFLQALNSFLSQSTSPGRNSFPPPYLCFTTGTQHVYRGLKRIWSGLGYGWGVWWDNRNEVVVRP